MLTSSPSASLCSRLPAGSHSTHLRPDKDPLGSHGALHRPPHSLAALWSPDDAGCQANAAVPSSDRKSGYGSPPSTQRHGRNGNPQTLTSAAVSRSSVHKNLVIPVCPVGTEISSPLPASQRQYLLSRLHPPHHCSQSISGKLHRGLSALIELCFLCLDMT